MSAPLPAREDPSTPAMLRQGLDALVELDPSYDVGAGLARFESTSAAAAVPSTGSAVLKIVVGSLLIALGGVAVAVATAGRDEPPPAGAAVVHAPSPAPEAVPTPERTHADDGPPARHRTGNAIAAADGAAIVDTSTLTPSPDPRPSTDGAAVAAGAKPRRAQRGAESTRTKTPRAAAPEASAHGDPLLAEMRLLNATRKQVASKRYTVALASVAAARELAVPRHFDEEWDALEILALAGAGRLERAQQLATPYLQRHARGRFNTSIERALESTATANR